MNLINARVTEISIQVAGLNDHRKQTDKAIDGIQKSIDSMEQGLFTLTVPVSPCVKGAG